MTPDDGAGRSLRQASWRWIRPGAVHSVAVTHTVGGLPTATRCRKGAQHGDDAEH
ncbi:hypothetical protein ACFFX0_14045 [Citricoccus parietis]|uniref:Uncharacterized protein n=1 Tax=Citricoccus parietis TaxID=592307 RepID=A0ABV5FZZ4_9MICC